MLIEMNLSSEVQKSFKGSVFSRTPDLPQIYKNTFSLKNFNFEYTFLTQLSEVFLIRKAKFWSIWWGVGFFGGWRRGGIASNVCS